MNEAPIPVISVIVLTYNQQHTVGRTIDSILAQKTHYPYEIIIGEDASPDDNTRGVCERYAELHAPKIRLLPQAANKGVVRNYVDCLMACRGKYIAICAGDDWWSDPEKLEIQVSFLEHNPDYVLTHGGVMISNVVTSELRQQRVVEVSPGADIFARLIKSNYIIAPTVCYRREAAERIDFADFIDRGYAMEDYPTWLALSCMGKFHAVDRPLVTYSISDSSISNHNVLDKQIAFEYSILNVRQGMVRSVGRQAQFSDLVLNNIFLRKAYRICMRFGDKQRAREYILRVKRKGVRDLFKLLKTFI